MSGLQADVRVVNALAPLHEAVQQHVARRVAQAEQALTVWTYAVLEAEVSLNQASFHEPPDHAVYAAEEPERTSRATGRPAGCRSGDGLPGSRARVASRVGERRRCRAPRCRT